MQNGSKRFSLSGPSNHVTGAYSNGWLKKQEATVLYIKNKATPQVGVENQGSPGTQSERNSSFL